MLSRCDVVFICLYPRATLEFLQLYRDAFKSGSVVTDISGVKTELLSSLPDCLRKDVDFISGHPCFSTSTLKLTRSDFLDRFLPAVGHAPVFVELPWPETE